MNTPIYDFVHRYAEKNGIRLHMPGHKGVRFTGCEPCDITEIKNADALYEADGIIKESEKNASMLFGTGATFYSAEGSSQCIKAMLYIAYIHRINKTVRPVVLASGNVHKSFVYACAMLDIDIVRLNDESDNYSLCRCIVTPESLKRGIESCNPFAVYITNPDYLGNMLDTKALSDAAHEFNVPLLVDNAHGAYLHFLKEKKHPMDLGADMCCDSAHKTLPVLTGGAYLHISSEGRNFEKYKSYGKKALELFGSTSPSYLILQSLDLCNRYLADGYEEKLADCIYRIEELKKKLRENGWRVENTDPLKLTVMSTGMDLGKILRANNIECEYEDPDFTVMMFTPENGEFDFDAVFKVIGECKNTEKTPNMNFEDHKRAMTVRQAVFSMSEKIKTTDCAGRVLSAPTVGCPPAVPVVVSGEIINTSDIEIFKRYGIEYVDVVKENV